MRKIILSMNITEDGFIAGPAGELDWHFPYWDSEMCESLCRVLNQADTLLLGRKTYNAFAAYWTAGGAGCSMSNEDLVLSDIMNRYSKIVVSKTLKSLPWMNSFLLQGDILTGNRQLKQKPGKDIVVLGSSRLVSYLIKHELIDEYHLWVHPVKIMRGKRISNLNHNKFKVKPTQVEQFNCGVARLYFMQNSSQSAIKSGKMENEFPIYTR